MSIRSLIIPAVIAAAFGSTSALALPLFDGLPYVPGHRAAQTPPIMFVSSGVVVARQYTYFRDEDGPNKKADVPPRPAKAVAGGTAAVKGYEYVGGDRVWDLAQHKYVLSGGRFVHSEECDHVIRTVKAPTPAEIESIRLQYGGGG